MGRRKGITLVEMLTVVAIVGVLAGILFPFFARASQLARTQLCANNLKRIGECMVIRAAGTRTWNLDALGGRNGYWVGSVVAYAGGSDCLKCPEASATGGDSPLTLQTETASDSSLAVDGTSLVPLDTAAGGEAVQQTQAAGGGEVSAAGGTPPNSAAGAGSLDATPSCLAASPSVGPASQAGGVAPRVGDMGAWGLALGGAQATWQREVGPVEEQIVIRPDPQAKRGIPLVSMMNGGKYKLLKLSQTQWDARIRDGVRCTPVPYVPDGNPNVYWWGVDDGPMGEGDYDFQDLAIKVVKNNDGTATLFVLADTPEDPEIWSRGLARCYARTRDINKHHHHVTTPATIRIRIGTGAHQGGSDSASGQGVSSGSHWTAGGASSAWSGRQTGRGSAGAGDQAGRGAGGAGYQPGSGTADAGAWSLVRRNVGSPGANGRSFTGASNASQHHAPVGTSACKGGSGGSLNDGFPAPLDGNLPPLPSSDYGTSDLPVSVMGGGKVQALDYFSSTARSTDNWNGSPYFMRHFGGVNVLFTGGAVRLMTQAQVDPGDYTNFCTYWAP